MFGSDCLPNAGYVIPPPIVLIETLDARLRRLASWTINNANHLRDSRDGLKVGGALSEQSGWRGGALLTPADEAQLLSQVAVAVPLFQLVTGGDPFSGDDVREVPSQQGGNDLSSDRQQPGDSDTAWPHQDREHGPIPRR